METALSLTSSKDFYEELDGKISQNLMNLNEMLDNVLEMRANCGRLMLDLKLQYKPEYLQELYTLTEEDEVKNIKQYMDLVKDITNQPRQKSDEDGKK